MSLNVTEIETKKAESRQLSEENFIEIIKDSLPFAYETVENLKNSLENGEEFAKIAPIQMNDEDRGQLLRLFASTSMRNAIEKKFGITLAFQNCHATGAVTLGNEQNADFQYFVSKEGQVLNQHPKLRDC